MRFFQLLHKGRCQSKSTLFFAQVFDTSMQVLKSAVEPSFEKMVMRISGGKRLIGERYLSLSLVGETAMSRKVDTPIDDWESLACNMKKSLSSKSALSGELAEEDSEAGSLETR